MRAQSGVGRGVNETYELLRRAAVRKQPVAAMYDNQPRLLCPHVLGRKAGRPHALVYQIGGRSNSRLPVVAAGGVFGAVWPSRNSVTLNGALMNGAPSHALQGKPALMR